jgi:hypothetical protein
MNNHHHHPHGNCECDGPCACAAAPHIVPVNQGPAAYRVEREGRQLRVCTLCVQIDDTRIEPVATLAELPLYHAYDPRGARLLSRVLRRRHATTTTTVN